MTINPIASNMNELKTDSPDHITVLFSYKTPVAAYGLSPQWHERFGSAYIRTSKRWSVTTSKHINKWLAGAKAIEVDQSVLDNLV